MKQLIATALVCLTFCALNAQYKYPETKTVDSADTYFGVTYKDPYRWLEYMHQPDVEKWFKDQADYTNTILNKVNGRDELIKEWKELDKLRPATYNMPSYKNGRFFYRKTNPGEMVGKLYYRQGLKGKEELLFDPTTFITGKTLTLEQAVPSHDGKKIAFSYSEQGAEVATLRIMDVDTKKLTTDSVHPVLFDYTWSFDNKAIVYRWIRSTDNNDVSSRLNPK